MYKRQVVAIALNLSASRNFTKSLLICFGIITAIKNCCCFGLRPFLAAPPDLESFPAVLAAVRPVFRCYELMEEYEEILERMPDGAASE